MANIHVLYVKKKASKNKKKKKKKTRNLIVFISMGKKIIIAQLSIPSLIALRVNEIKKKLNFDDKISKSSLLINYVVTQYLKFEISIIYCVMIAKQ